MSEDLQHKVNMLNAYLKGQRRLIETLQDELRETMAERDKLAGIGIECGCGEDTCTADADNLRDALAQIRSLKAEIDRLNEALKDEQAVSGHRADEIERLRVSSFVTAVPYDHYERIVKAGDGMASAIQFNEEMSKDYSGATIVRQCVKEWNKAKGGEPTK